MASSTPSPPQIPLTKDDNDDKDKYEDDVSTLATSDNDHDHNQLARPLRRDTEDSLTLLHEFDEAIAEDIILKLQGIAVDKFNDIGLKQVQNAAFLKRRLESFIEDVGRWRWLGQEIEDGVRDGVEGEFDESREIGGEEDGIALENERDDGAAKDVGYESSDDEEMEEHKEWFHHIGDWVCGVGGDSKIIKDLEGYESDESWDHKVWKQHQANGFPETESSDNEADFDLDPDAEGNNQDDSDAETINNDATPTKENPKPDPKRKSTHHRHLSAFSTTSAISLESSSTFNKSLPFLFKDTIPLEYYSYTEADYTRDPWDRNPDEYENDADVDSVEGNEGEMEELMMVYRPRKRIQRFIKSQAGRLGVTSCAGSYKRRGWERESDVGSKSVEKFPSFEEVLGKGDVSSDENTEVLEVEAGIKQLEVEADLEQEGKEQGGGEKHVVSEKKKSIGTSFTKLFSRESSLRE